MTISLDEDNLKGLIKEAIEEIFFSEEEYGPFIKLNDKVSKLINLKEIEERVEIAIKWADKFEDYMKNMNKLNEMINEFKGLVAIVRGEAKTIQDENLKLKIQMRKILEIFAEK